MAFGKKAVKAKVQYTDGVDYKSIFFPQQSGPGGVRVVRQFRLLPDSEHGEETEVVFREWQCNDVMLNGKKVYKPIIVEDRNVIDSAVWDEINAVKADASLDEAKKKTLISELRKGLTKQQFAINVYHVSDTEDEPGSIKVLKGSWEAHRLVFKDDLTEVPEDYYGDRETSLVLSNPNGGGTIYAKMIAAMQEGASIPDGRKRILVKDPTKFNLKHAASGEGQFGKKNEISPGDVYEMLDEFNLPRYDIATWVERATFSDAAVQEIINGVDYNEVVEKYGIQKYPELFGQYDAILSDDETPF